MKRSSTVPPGFALCVFHHRRLLQIFRSEVLDNRESFGYATDSGPCASHRGHSTHRRPSAGQACLCGTPCIFLLRVEEEEKIYYYYYYFCRLALKREIES
jgi:hypothetical protein